MKKITSLFLLLIFLSANSPVFCAGFELISEDMIKIKDNSRTSTNNNSVPASSVVSSNNTYTEKPVNIKAENLRLELLDLPEPTVIKPASNIPEDRYIEEIETRVRKLTLYNYGKKTVLKHFAPYEVNIKNTGVYPILLTDKTEIRFVTNTDSTIQSEPRHEIYSKTRKRDRFKYYTTQGPMAIVGAGISVFSFLVLTPLSVWLYKKSGGPVNNSAKINVDILDDLYVSHGLPLRLDPGVNYSVYFYPPKKTGVKEVIIKNVLMDYEIRDIKIPLSGAMQ